MPMTFRLDLARRIVAAIALSSRQGESLCESQGYWEFDAKNRPEGWNIGLTLACRWAR
jgi:hypothetical protein